MRHNPITPRILRNAEWAVNTGETTLRQFAKGIGVGYTHLSRRIGEKRKKAGKKER